MNHKGFLCFDYRTENETWPSLKPPMADFKIVPFASLFGAKCNYEYLYLLIDIRAYTSSLILKI